MEPKRVESSGGLVRIPYIWIVVYNLGLWRGETVWFLYIKIG